MIIRIGEYEQVFTTSLLLRDGEEAYIEFPAGGGLVKLTWKTSRTPEGNAHALSFQTKDDVVKFHANYNRENDREVMMMTFMRFGEVGTRSVYIKYVVSALGTTVNFVTLFFYLDASKS